MPDPPQQRPCYRSPLKEETVPRVKRGIKRRWKRKKILAQAKGYYQRKSKLYRYAKEAVDRSHKFAYVGRRLKKRDFRSLWIIRIAAGARANGLPYNRFIYGLKLADIELNRKMLAELAAQDPGTFTQLVEKAKAAIETGLSSHKLAGESSKTAKPASEQSVETSTPKTTTPSGGKSPPSKKSPEKPKRAAKKAAVRKSAPKNDGKGKAAPIKKAAARKKTASKTESSKKTAQKKTAKKNTSPKKVAAGNKELNK